MFRVFFVISVFLFLISCKSDKSTGPVEAPGKCYGDSVCTHLFYDTKKDTLGITVLEITVGMQNVSGRKLVVDSTVTNTYIEIYPDSTGVTSYIWKFPENIKPDSQVYRIELAADKSRVYSGVWRRINDKGLNIEPGNYVIKGCILGFRANDVKYTEL
jgi:hypothetical protein